MLHMLSQLSNGCPLVRGHVLYRLFGTLEHDRLATQGRLSIILRLVGSKQILSTLTEGALPFQAPRLCLLGRTQGFQSIQEKGQQQEHISPNPVEAVVALVLGSMFCM